MAPKYKVGQLRHLSGEKSLFLIVKHREDIYWSVAIQGLHRPGKTTFVDRTYKKEPTYSVIFCVEDNTNGA